MQLTALIFDQDSQTTSTKTVEVDPKTIASIRMSILNFPGKTYSTLHIKNGRVDEKITVEGSPLDLQEKLGLDSRSNPVTTKPSHNFVTVYEVRWNVIDRTPEVFLIEINPNQIITVEEALFDPSSLAVDSLVRVRTVVGEIFLVGNRTDFLDQTNTRTLTVEVYNGITSTGFTDRSGIGYGVGHHGRTLPEEDSLPVHLCDTGQPSRRKIQHGNIQPTHDRRAVKTPHRQRAKDTHP